MSLHRLEARGIVVDFGGKVVLDGASICVSAGEIAVLTGPSGSGKSTLLRVMATLRQPLAGQVVLDDVGSAAISPREFRKRVAFVPQHPPMLEGSVEDNVAAGPKLRGRSVTRVRVHELMSRVGLEHALAEQTACELSGGEKQRVAIARALANEPEFLLFDEPTAALDPSSATHLIGAIRELAVEGLGIVVVTHHRGHVDALAGTRYECSGGLLSRVDSSSESE